MNLYRSKVYKPPPIYLGVYNLEVKRHEKYSKARDVYSIYKYIYAT